MCSLKQGAAVEKMYRLMLLVKYLVLLFSACKGIIDYLFLFKYIVRIIAIISAFCICPCLPQVVSGFANFLCSRGTTTRLCPRNSSWLSLWRGSMLIIFRFPFPRHAENNISKHKKFYIYSKTLVTKLTEFNYYTGLHRRIPPAAASQHPPLLHRRITTN